MKIPIFRKILKTINIPSFSFFFYPEFTLEKYVEKCISAILVRKMAAYKVFLSVILSPLQRIFLRVQHLNHHFA